MLHATSVIAGRNAGNLQRRGIVSGRLAAMKRRSGVSLLGLALAGAAFCAGPGRADTLDLQGATAQRVDFDHTPGAPYDIVQNGTLQLTNSGALTFAGTLQDNGGGGGVFSLQKFGNGTLTLTGTSTYTGETVLYSGTLAAGAVNAFSANSIVHSNGGAVDLAGFNQTVAGLTGGGQIGNSSGTAATLTIQVASGVVGQLFGTSIAETAGAIAVVKSGAGEQDQSNASNYTGGTTLTGGTLGIGNNAALGTGAVTFNGPATLSFIGSGLSLANDIVLTSDGTIQRSGDPSTLSGIISGAGGLILPGKGSILINGANTYAGGTQIGGGIVGIGNDQAFGTGAITINTLSEFDSAANHSLPNNFTLNDQLRVAVTGPGAVLQLNGVLSGPGGIWLLPSTTGTLVLNSANTYTGGTLLSSGVLQVNNSAALGTSGVVAPTSATLRAGAAGLTTANNLTLQGTLTVDTNGNDYVLSGSVQDLNTPGGLRKIGTGTLTLSGTNAYSGGTTVEGGVVAISADSALGANAGALTLAGGGLELTGTAAVAMSRGVVLNAAGNVVAVDNAGGALNLSGTVSGSGDLTKQGVGTLNLLAANSYSGGTVATAGTLGVGVAGALGSGSLTLVNSVLTTLADNLSFSNALTVTNAAITSNGFNLTLTGPIGGGNFTKFGPGTLTLSGNNTLTGGIAVAAGGLAVGSNTALGPNSLGLFGGAALIAAADNLVLANNIEIVSNGTPITVDTRAATLTLNGDVNYTGPFGIPVIKAGSGTLIANGTWFGGTQEVVNVTAGTLQANGTINAGQLNVSSGATLSGTGTVTLPGLGATVSIADGGTLSPGTAVPGRLTVDNLTLSAGTQVNFKLGQAGVVGGANNDLVVVNGQLTLAGVLNVANGPFFTSGTYTLFTYGAITDNGLTLGTLPSGYAGTVVIVAGSGTSGAVTLQTLGNSIQYWDGTGALADHVVSGGSGTWNSSSFNWASADGASNSVWNNQQAIFQTVGGAVTVAGTQQFNKLVFAVDGYHLSGDGLSAVSGGSIPVPEINVASGAATIVDNVISGTGGLLKSGAGTLTLNGDSTATLTGGISIGGGRLNFGSSGAVGTGAVELFDGTTLGAAAALTLANNLTLDNHATVDINGLALTLGGVIGGPGSLTITDTGATALAGLVTLTGSNGYTGGTTITGARASVAADAALGDAAGGLALNGGVLLTSASFSSARGVTLTGDSSFVPASGTTLTLTGVIGGSGSLRQSGPGTLGLGGTNTYTGGTFVNAGTLSIGSDANLGVSTGGLSLLGATLQLTGDVTALRPVAIVAANTIDTGAFTLTLNGPVTNTGTLTKIGSGTLALNGNNSSVAPTLLNQGIIQVGSNSAIGGGGLAMADGTTLAAGLDGVMLADAVTTAGIGTIDSGAGSLSLNGAISGAGSLIKIGSGTLNLNGANSFNGLNITAGTLAVGTSTAAGGGGIMIGSATLAAGVTGLVLTNAIADVGAAAVNSGSGVFTLAGPITGSGSITKIGAGNLVLNGNNGFSGLSLTSGTATLGTNTAAGSGPVNMSPNTTLAAGTAGLVVANAITVNGADIIDAGSGSFTLNSVIGGTGSISKTGSGNLVLNGNNSFVGLNVNVGAVTLGTSTAGGSGGIALADQTTLAAGVSGLVLTNAITTAGVGGIDSGAGTLTLLGTVSGAGGLVKAGSGNLVLDAANSFNGLGIVAGTVTVDTGTSAGSGGIVMNDGTTLAAGAAGLVLDNNVLTSGVDTIDSGGVALTLNGAISGPGTLAKAGLGNLVLNGDNSFAGLNLNTGSVTLGSNTAAGTGTIAMADQTTLIAGVQGLVIANALTTAGLASIDSGSGSFTLNGTVGGAGSITKLGLGNLVLNGSNGFTGLGITAGTVTVGSNTAAGIGNIALGDGTTLAAGTDGLVLANAVTTAGISSVDSGAGSLTLGGQVTGTGSITKVGAGNLALNGSNGFNGLTVNAGTVSVGTNSAAGNGTISLAQGTTLAAGTDGLVLANTVVTQGASIDSGGGTLTLAGPVTGDGALTKLGAGTLTLTGSNSYAGPTSVAAGTLAVNGINSGSGAVNVLAGATLTGGGSIAGVVSIADGATISPGAGVGTLTTGGLVLGNAATLAFQLGQANVIGGASNDLLQVNGNLTLGGKLNVTDSGGFGNGVYRLINYTGALTDNGLAVNSLPASYAGQIQTVVPGAVTLLITAPNTAVQYWDGADMAGNGVVDGGSGTWSATGSNWTSAAPSTINSSWAGGVAIFSNTAGTVAVAGTQAFQGLQFTSAGYVLTGGTLAASAGSFIATNGGTTTIGSTLTGGSITKQGAGTLALTGGNSFAALNIAAGTVSLGSNTAGGSGNIGLADGTTLAAAASLQLANTLSTAGSGTIDTGANSLTLGGIVSGPGSITKLGSGTLVFNNSANTFAGLNVAAGTIMAAGGTSPSPDHSFGTGSIMLATGTTLAGGGGVSELANAIVVTGTVQIDSGNAPPPPFQGPIGFLNLDGNITGTGSLVKISTGGLGLNGINSFNGLVIASGSVSAQSSGVGNGSIALLDGTSFDGFGVFANTFSVTGSGTFGSRPMTLNGAVSGPGSVISTGTLVLNGANSFTGLTISGGSVTIGNNSAPGNGGIALNGGTLRAGADGLALANAISLNGVGTVDTQGFALTLNGPITGLHQTLAKIGSGTLTLNGDNSYTGGTQLSAGAITVGSNTALGTQAVFAQAGTQLTAGVSGLVLTNTIFNSGALTIDSGAGALALNGSIYGSGQITKIGAGNLTLGANNGFNGLAISAGRVTATGFGAVGQGDIALADSTTLASGLAGLGISNAISTAGAGTIDTGAGMLTLYGPITGAGSITKLGTGGLVLTGSSSYAGATTVTAGTLSLDGSSTGTGAVTVQSGATLAGTGSTAAVVTIANGATIAPGNVIGNGVDNGVGTLTTGGLVLASGANLAYQLGQANVIGGTFNDLLQVNGNLTLGGGLTVTDSGSFGSGVYRLINYTGTLTDNGLAITSLPGGNVGQIQTALGGTVNLLVTAPGALVQYWDGADMAGNGKIDGGSGSWTATNTNWTTAAPSTINSSWAGGVAVFGGTAGAVTVTGTQAVQGLQFASAGYVLTGGTLAASAGAFIATNGGTTTISSTITGAGALSKQGAGNLVLNGSNSFTGLNITAGSVTLGSNTAGGTGAIALANSTTLAAGVSGLVLANAVSTAGAGTLDSGTGTFTLNGMVSGPGGIAKAGSGNLVLNGANGYAGLAINAGIVTLGTNTAGGTGGIALADSTTLAAGVSGLVLTNAVSTAGVGTLDSGAGTFTLNGVVSGPGSIAKAGIGNLVLNGSNGFTGLVINTGTVTLGTATAGGTGGIALANGATLAAGTTGLVLTNAVSTAGTGTIDSGNGVFTLNGVISGPGSIAKAGSGTLTLNGANSFNGLAVNTGTVMLGTNTAGGTGPIALANGTTLAAGSSGLVLGNAVSTAGIATLDTGAGVFTFAGPITGPGSITKVGAGNLVLNGSNSFTGLGVNAGTVTLGTSTAAGSGSIALANGTTLAAGASGLVLANAVSTAGIGTVDGGAGVFTLNGAITGPGSITKVGSGNLVLNGSNSFAGLGVTTGTVTVGSNTAAGIGTIALTGGTTLAAGANGLTLANAVTTAAVGTVNTNGFDLTLGGPISGPGSLVYTGGGSLTVSGVDSYAGATTVASGQLRVIGSLTNSVVTLASGTSIRGTGSVGGLVASSGSAVAPGLGTTVGTLSVAGNAVFQSGSTFAVNVGATTADRLAVGGTATLAGTLALNQVVGPLAPFTTYTLLTAAGGRSGTFGTVTYGNAIYNAAFTPTVTYTANNVLLGLQANSLVARVGGSFLTQNERNVATAYDAAIGAGFNPSGFAALFAPGLSLPDALNQLSGEVHSAERRVAMDDTRHVREAALDRLGTGFAATPGKDDSAATSEHDGRSYTLWARGVGAWGTNRSDGNGSAFNTSTGGAIVGIDMGFDGGKIGALFNYTTTTLDHYALGQSKVESTGGGIYAGYRQDHGFAAAAGASVAGIKARSSRTITVPGLGQTLAGRSDGNTYQAFADISYDLASGPTTHVEPFLRFAWVALDTAAFTETGGNAALTAARGAYTTDITTAGLRGAVALKGFTLKASAGAQHTGGDRSPVALLALTGDNSPASISAVPVDRWALAADLSGEFRLARNATFAVGYSGVNGNRTRDNGVRGTLTFGF